MPKVIASGESVTIPAGRVAVLPNVQVDGTLTVNGDVFIPAGATFGDLESQIASKVSTSAIETSMAPYNKGFKNYIINGGMNVNQYEAAAVAVTAAGQFPLDRMHTIASQSNKITAQQRTSGTVSMGNAPFENCLQVSTVSGYSLTATDQFRISHKIEGLNTANFRFGRSNAKTITLSFWVKSSVVGLYAVSFRNSAVDRSYVTTYTINTANTFEYKTITIDGDTSGTWLYGNGIGLRIEFNLASGSTYTTSTPNQWVDGSYTSATGVVNNIATTGNDFYITGIQLEDGSVATPFEQRPYGLELSLCQRYYWAAANPSISIIKAGGTWSSTSLVFPVPMRVTPTVSFTNNQQGDWTGGTNVATKHDFRVSSSNSNVGSCELLNFRASAEL